VAKNSVGHSVPPLRERRGGRNHPSEILLKKKKTRTTLWTGEREGEVIRVPEERDSEASRLLLSLEMEIRRLHI